MYLLSALCARTPSRIPHCTSVLDLLSSSGLCWVLGLSLVVTLTVRRLGRSGRMPHSWDWSDGFLTGIWAWGRVPTEVKCPSQPVVSGVHVINVTHPTDAALDHLAGAPPISLLHSHTPLPPSTLSSSAGTGCLCTTHTAGHGNDAFFGHEDQKKKKKLVCSRNDQYSLFHCWGF